MRLTPGDCFLQPPEIRHRVLHSGDDLQVIEIGVPAEHVTEIDHDMALPTPDLRPDRVWGGQKFVFSQASGGKWGRYRLPGFECRDTSIGARTGAVAGVQVVRRGQGTPVWAAHDGDILFNYVMAGHVTLEGEGRAPYALEPGDAFVIPPGMKTRLSGPSDDIELLEVTLPGAFNTTLAPS